MLKRITFLTALALFATASTVAAAGKSTPVKPYSGPIVSVNPLHAKPGAKFAIKGVRFASGAKLHVEMDCPMFGHTEHGQWVWSVHTDAKGNFAIKTKVPMPKKVKKAFCGVYVLNITKKSAAWISTGFQIG